MVKGTPVEIVSTGSDGSISPSRNPAARTTASRSCCGPNFGSSCVISPKAGWPEISSKRTGTRPAFKSSVISSASVVPAQRECSSQRRMAGKGQLFLHRKDAHPNAALSFQRRVARQNEGGFREVHLAGDGLHFLVRESPAIEKNSQRIAGKMLRREDIQLHEAEASRFCHHGERIVALPKLRPTAATCRKFRQDFAGIAAQTRIVSSMNAARDIRCVIGKKRANKARPSRRRQS